MTAEGGHAETVSGEGPQPRALQLLSVVPTIVASCYFLGGLVLAIQARDAGLPWKALIFQQNARLLLLGLQVLIPALGFLVVLC